MTRYGEFYGAVAGGCDRLVHPSIDGCARSRQRRLVGLLLAAPFLVAGAGVVLVSANLGAAPTFAVIFAAFSLDHVLLATVCGTVGAIVAVALLAQMDRTVDSVVRQATISAVVTLVGDVFAHPSHFPPQWAEPLVTAAVSTGIAIALWFFFVLVFDLLLLGALVVSGGNYGGELFPYLLLANPADVFRILNIFSLEDVRTLYGLATVFPAALAQPWLLGLVMLGWIAAPLALAAWRFKQ